MILSDEQLEALDGLADVNKAVKQAIAEVDVEWERKRFEAQRPLREAASNLKAMGVPISRMKEVLGTKDHRTVRNLIDLAEVSDAPVVPKKIEDDKVLTRNTIMRSLKGVITVYDASGTKWLFEAVPMGAVTLINRHVPVGHKPGTETAQITRSAVAMLEREFGDITYSFEVTDG